MAFSLATFNALDLLDDTPPVVIGGLDAHGVFGAEQQATATRLYRAKIAALARTVARLDADVLALQEVKNARVLEDLLAALPNRGGYVASLSGKADVRGIGCGLLTRFPVQKWTERVPTDLPFPVFVEGDTPPYAGRLSAKRAVVEATVALPDGSSLVVLVVHFKSQLPGLMLRSDGSAMPFTDHRSVAEGLIRSQVTRLAEALALRAVVDEHLDRDPNVQLAVVGDFNDHANSLVVRTVAGDVAMSARAERLAAMRGTDDRGFAHRALFACAQAVPPQTRHTVFFKGEVEQIDHVLVTEALWTRFQSATILNEFLGEQMAALTESSEGAVESDHAPIRVSFR
jgi:endonuclease/exonuclease/phosphatase family metal-dependent hydrolase